MQLDRKRDYLVMGVRLSSNKSIIFSQCGRRIMVITGASQASDASSILVARSRNNVSKVASLAAFVFQSRIDYWLENQSFFQYFVQYVC